MTITLRVAYNNLSGVSHHIDVLWDHNFLADASRNVSGSAERRVGCEAVGNRRTRSNVGMGSASAQIVKPRSVSALQVRTHQTQLKLAVPQRAAKL